MSRILSLFASLIVFLVSSYRYYVYDLNPSNYLLMILIMLIVFAYSNETKDK